MLEKIEDIKYKLFPIRYSTLKEYFFWHLSWLLLLWWICVIITGEVFTGEMYYDLLFLIINIWVLYCGSYRPMQWLFKKKGKKYEGRIIRTEMMYGVGEDTFYFFIEFKKGKKTLIRRTSGYEGNPYMYLENEKCCVYEYMGKFIEADFNVRKRFPKKADESLDFHITKHKLFMPKGNKYV